MTDPEHHYSKDGSSTLYSKDFGQFYHNPNGAVTESRHVFFDTPGLTDFLNSDHDLLSVFEVGFGTGLNFLLLCDEYLQRGLSYPLHFYSVEAFPVEPDIAKNFNYREFIAHNHIQDKINEVFNSLEPGWNTFSLFPDHEIYLHLYIGKFEEIISVEHPVQFIFHDPFSPEVNEELWSVETFEKLKRFSRGECRLATYCAATKARASMADAGWFPGRAKGALGKREMTIATLEASRLGSFKRLNEKKLIDRLHSGDFDQ